MSIKKENFSDKFKFCSETRKESNGETIVIKSLLRRSTGICAVSTEIHKNLNTDKTTIMVEKKFDRSTGNMIEQTSTDYDSGLLTTEKWSSSSGATKPLSIIEKNFS